MVWLLQKYPSATKLHTNGKTGFFFNVALPFNKMLCISKMNRKLML